MSHVQIPLTQGQVTLVNASDYDFLMQWKWYAASRPHTDKFYVQRQLPIGNGRYTTIHMHRIIMGLEQGDIRQCDHKNMNPLDNRRENLRICTRSQNVTNTPARSALGFKGAYFRKDLQKWQAQISDHGKLKSLGFYLTPQEAGDAYCEAAKRIHGEFARIS